MKLPSILRVPLTSRPGRGAIFVVFLVWMASINCGTIVSRTEPGRQVILGPGPTIPTTELYSGVVHDLRWFPFSILDLPFSLVADTLLAPYDIFVAIFVERRISTNARRRLAALGDAEVRVGKVRFRLQFDPSREHLELVRVAGGRRFKLRLRHDQDVRSFFGELVGDLDYGGWLLRTSPEYAEDLESLYESLGPDSGESDHK